MRLPTRRAGADLGPSEDLDRTFDRLGISKQMLLAVAASAGLPVNNWSALLDRLEQDARSQWQRDNARNPIDLLQFRIEEQRAPTICLRRDGGLLEINVGNFADPYLVEDHAHARGLLDIVDAARSDQNVLIHAPRGAGKEAIFRLIHALSPRRSEPLIVINSAEIPSGIAETILFGHAKGSFTGATHDSVGLLRRAHGGILALDEVADLPPEVQPKLLRVIQYGSMRSVGGDADHHVDVRVVAATNRDLKHLRPELLDRIAEFQVGLPPLKDRPCEIIPLALQSLRRCARDQGSAAPGIVPSAAEKLSAHEWPGNIRELNSVVRRAFGYARGGSVIIPEHLVFRGLDETPRIANRRGPKVRLTVDRLEQALQTYAGRSASYIAGQINVSEATLSRHLKRLGKVGQ